MRTTGVPCTVIGSVSGEQGHGGTRAYLVLEHPWPWRDSSGCWWQLQNPSLGGISASLTTVIPTMYGHLFCTRRFTYGSSVHLYSNPTK